MTHYKFNNDEIGWYILQSRIRIWILSSLWWAEVGKVNLKSNGDEALNDEFLLKSNSDEALNDGFS